MSLELRSLLPYPNSCLGTSPHQQGRVTKMLSFCAIDEVVWADGHSGRHNVTPHGSRCAGRFGRVRAVAARSAGARSASLDAAESTSDLAATRSQLLIR